jgi:hypothetical protein
MKNLLVLILGSLILSGAANATSLQRTSFARLTPQVISDGHVSLQRAQYAEVLVKHFDQTVRLTVFVAPNSCPPGHACAAVMPAPRVIELPIQERYENACGSYVYNAELVNPPVGGEIERLTVVDNTGNRCPATIALPETEVSYETTAAYPGYQGPYFSTFTGERLH